jgi:ribonuclease R
MASGKGRRGERNDRAGSNTGTRARTQDTRRDSAPPKPGQRLRTAELLELLAREQAPVGWRELVALTRSDEPASRKALRMLVKGMLRSGEIVEDHQGHYHPAAVDGEVGLLTGRGRNLLFDGAPVEGTREFRLRPGDRVAATVIDDRAQVLRVVERSSQPVVGELRYHGRYPHVESVSPEYRGRVNLEEPPQHGDDGDTVAVRITGEDRHGLVGVVTEVISTTSGSAREGGAAHAAQTLLVAHRVPCEWPGTALRAADKLPGQVQPGRHQDRVSLMDLPLVTIDGETARDFDDAVYAERVRGGWRLLVAIADVAHYVKPGSPLDTCAWERGNSVYLPDRVVPMLPEALSNGLCSLRPHEPRLALVCDMRLTAKGNVTRFEFYEALIRSWQRLTYNRVQEFLDAGVLDVEAEVQASLRNLKDVYDALRGAREVRGALDFDTHEAVLELDNGHVKAIHPVARQDAHRLIEEAMISANVCAARYLEDRQRGALYRVHEPPDAQKTDQLRQALAFAGVRLSKGETTPKLVHDALQQLGDRPDKWIFEMLALRSMTQAAYSPDNAGHYGLTLERYMHFTSPIRRYADLVVHRAIKGTLGQAGEAPMSADWLATTGAHISLTERRAEDVARGVDGWLKCEYIAGRIGETFDGVVMSVTEFGLFVELSGFFVQGLVHISELGQDYFRFHAGSMTLVGDRSGRRFGLGDSLKVKLVDVQPAAGKVDLVLVAKSSDGERRPRRRKRGNDDA